MIHNDMQRSGEGVRVVGVIPTAPSSAGRRASNMVVKLPARILHSLWCRIPVVSLYVLFFLAFRVGLHFSIVDGLLGTNGVDFVRSFQLDSDGLVFRRLEQNRLTGIFSGEMGLRLDDSNAQPYGPFYESQFGLGGWLLTLVPTVLGLFGSSGASMILTFVAGFNAVVATVAVVSARRAVSVGAAVLCALALLQPWPVAMAHSAYWMIGLKLLPAWALAALYARGRDTRGRVFLMALGSSTLTFLSGYEFITIVVATALGVVTYYSVVRQQTVSRAVKEIACALGGCLSGFALALLIHFAQLRLRLGGMSVALEALVGTVAKRTGATSMQVDPVYLESLAARPNEVLTTYLDVPVIGSPLILPVVGSFTVAAFLAVCTSVILVGAQQLTTRTSDLRPHALGTAWFVTLLGPIGWFLLARPHSYIHTHINPSLWYLPVIPLGAVLMWQPLSAGARALSAQRLAVMALACVVLCLVIFYAYSLATVQ